MKKYIKTNITFAQATFFNCLVHVFTVYIPPYVDPISMEEETKVINHLAWMVRIVFSKFLNSRVIVMGDFNQHLQAVAETLEPMGVLPVIAEGISTHR